MTANTNNFYKNETEISILLFFLYVFLVKSNFSVTTSSHNNYIHDCP